MFNVEYFKGISFGIGGPDSLIDCGIGKHFNVYASMRFGKGGCIDEGGVKYQGQQGQ